MELKTKLSASLYIIHVNSPSVEFDCSIHCEVHVCVCV